MTNRSIYFAKEQLNYLPRNLIYNDLLCKLRCGPYFRGPRCERRERENLITESERKTEEKRVRPKTAPPRATKSWIGPSWCI